LTLVLTSCDAKKEPKNVVEEYLTAIDNFNIEEAKSLVVQNSKNLKSINNIKVFAEKMTPFEKEKYIKEKKIYHYIEEEITANSARIVATNNQGDYTIAIEFELVKQNDHWLIEKVKSN